MRGDGARGPQRTNRAVDRPPVGLKRQAIEIDHRIVQARMRRQRPPRWRNHLSVADVGQGAGERQTTDKTCCSGNENAGHEMRLRVVNRQMPA